MSLSVEIEDGKGGTKNKVKVTSLGQLVVAPLEFSEPLFNAIALTATAYNFVEPVAGKRFVITGYIAATDKNVSSTNGAEIAIIESSAIDSTVASKVLLTLDLGKLDSQVITGLNMITSPGVWINASTDDATVNLTILGYYISV